MCWNWGREWWEFCIWQQKMEFELTGFGFYNILWAAKAHLLLMEPFLQNCPTLIKFKRTQQFCCIFTTKMMWLFMSQPHLPVMNGNNSQIRGRPRYSTRGDVERARWTSHQLEVTLSLQQSTLGSPRTRKFPAHLLMADKDSPSFQKSLYRHLIPDAVPKTPWTTLATRPTQELCGVTFFLLRKYEYERKKQHCLCATAPVHECAGPFLPVFSLSGLDNYEVNVRVHWWQHHQATDGKI